METGLLGDGPSSMALRNISSNAVARFRTSSPPLVGHQKSQLPAVPFKKRADKRKHSAAKSLQVGEPTSKMSKSNLPRSAHQPLPKKSRWDSQEKVPQRTSNQEQTYGQSNNTSVTINAKAKLSVKEHEQSNPECDSHKAAPKNASTSSISHILSSKNVYEEEATPVETLDRSTQPQTQTSSPPKLKLVESGKASKCEESKERDKARNATVSQSVPKVSLPMDPIRKSPEICLLSSKEIRKDIINQDKHHSIAKTLKKDTFSSDKDSSKSKSSSSSHQRKSTCRLDKKSSNSKRNSKDRTSTSEPVLFSPDVPRTDHVPSNAEPKDSKKERTHTEKNKETSKGDNQRTDIEKSSLYPPKFNAAFRIPKRLPNPLLDTPEPEKTSRKQTETWLQQTPLSKPTIVKSKTLSATVVEKLVSREPSEGEGTGSECGVQSPSQTLASGTMASEGYQSSRKTKTSCSNKTARTEEENRNDLMYILNGQTEFDLAAEVQVARSSSKHRNSADKQSLLKRDVSVQPKPRKNEERLKEADETLRSKKKNNVVHCETISSSHNDTSEEESRKSSRRARSRGSSRKKCSRKRRYSSDESYTPVNWSRLRSKSNTRSGGSNHSSLPPSPAHSGVASRTRSRTRSPSSKIANPFGFSGRLSTDSESDTQRDIASSWDDDNIQDWLDKSCTVPQQPSSPRLLALDKETLERTLRDTKAKRDIIFAKKDNYITIEQIPSSPTMPTLSLLNDDSPTCQKEMPKLVADSVSSDGATSITLPSSVGIAHCDNFVSNGSKVSSNPQPPPNEAGYSTLLVPGNNSAPLILESVLSGNISNTLSTSNEKSAHQPQNIVEEIVHDPGPSMPTSETRNVAPDMSARSDEPECIEVIEIEAGCDQKDVEIIDTETNNDFEIIDLESQAPVDVNLPLKELWERLQPGVRNMIETFEDCLRMANNAVLKFISEFTEAEKIKTRSLKEEEFGDIRREFRKKFNLSWERTENSSLPLLSQFSKRQLFMVLRKRLCTTTDLSDPQSVMEDMKVLYEFINAPKKKDLERNCGSNVTLASKLFFLHMSKHEYALLCGGQTVAVDNGQEASKIQGIKHIPKSTSQTTPDVEIPSSGTSSSFHQKPRTPSRDSGYISPQQESSNVTSQTQERTTESEEEDSNSEIPNCVHCDNTAEIKCSACIDVFYCSTKCQKEHWIKGHYKNCLATKASSR